MIPTGMTCVCKAHLDELGTHLQMCKFKNGLTIRTHDLNREIAEFHKGVGFLTTLVVKPQFQSADDPDVWTKTDQVIVRSGLPPLLIDTTISNVCSDQSRPKKYEGETQISGSCIIKGTVKDQRLHGRMQENWPRLFASDVRVSGKHRTDVRATL